MQSGNIGYITTSPDQRLFKVDSVQNGIVYVRSTTGPLTFHRITPDEFWCVLEVLP